MNVILTLKNHWKKSVFFVAAGGFGVNYANTKWKDHKLMQAYCLEAKKYGDMILESTKRPKRVTVILNPAANKGKGKSVYEKNVAPILHLAGMEVNLIMTKHEGQAKKIMGELEKSSADAVIIAGGNGTLSEAITGLLRRPDEAELSSAIPLCVVPLGKTNSLAQSLYLPAIGNTVQFIAELALSSVTGPSKQVDVMHVKGNDDKSVYAVSNLSVGTFTEAEIRKKRNWYFGPLKDYLCYVVTTARYWTGFTNCNMSYTLPCSGCNKCKSAPKKVQWSWLHLFVRPKYDSVKDYSDIHNELCGKVFESNNVLAQVDLHANKNISKDNVGDAQLDEPKFIGVQTISGDLDKSEFIEKGWNRVKDQKVDSEKEATFQVDSIKLEFPDKEEDGKKGLVIDNENFEIMKTLNIKLLPNKLNFYYCPKNRILVEDAVV